MGNSCATILQLSLRPGLPSANQACSYTYSQIAKGKRILHYLGAGFGAEIDPTPAIAFATCHIIVRSRFYIQVMRS